MEASVIILAAFVVVQFIYTRRKMSKLEDGMINLEAEIDYIQDVVQMLRKDYSRIVIDSIRRSKPVKSKRKPGPGRPVNPNSVRQRKMRGEK